ncbi:uncharacterized protein V1518DRAFT_306903 [Limtongia smithiae]|uniref:uncharacterized protein n=1 Tax=Limtongia smithiae TaxID=1125753 RepID=UPI0034CE6FAB
MLSASARAARSATTTRLAAAASAPGAALLPCRRGLKTITSTRAISGLSEGASPSAPQPSPPPPPPSYGSATDAPAVKIDMRNSFAGKVIILDDVLGISDSTANIASRNQFVRNRAHLVSLLDALIAGGKLARARKVLDEAYTTLDGDEFLRLRNNYIKGLADEELRGSGSLQATLTYFKESEKTLDRLTFDAATFATLLSAACKLPDKLRGDVLIKQLIDDVISTGRKPIEVLSLESMFTFTDARRIAAAATLPESELPGAFQAKTGYLTEPIASFDKDDDCSGSLSEALGRAQSAALKSSLAQLPESVNKPGYDTLNPVESIGIKLLRSSLQGVADDSKPVLPVYSFNPDKGENPDDDVFIDFEEQLRLLPEKEQKAYRDAFELYNQQRQGLLETLALETARERWKYDHDQMIARGDMSVTNVNEYLWEWHQAMTEQLQEEFKRIEQLIKSDMVLRTKGGSSSKTTADKQRMRYGAFLTLVPAEKLSAITILEVMRLHSTGGPSQMMRTARTVLTVGRAVEMEYNSEQLLKGDAAELGILKPTKAILQNPQEFSRMLSIAKKRNEEQQVIRTWKPEWPDDVKADIGSTLVSILMHVAKVAVTATDPVTGKDVTSIVPAITHSYQYSQGLKLGVLRVHKDFASKLSHDPAGAMIHPQQLPMLIKPLKWAGANVGGYLYTSTPLMRTKNSVEQMAYLREACRRNDLQSVFEGLDVLGSTAWIINSNVFRVVAKVWNSGKDFLEIPAKMNREKLEFPPEPEKDADPAVRRDWARKCKMLILQARTSHSQRCDINYKLEIARAFIGERIYFPHNLDFRGRAYAVPPHLNHLGNDMCRGLLMFWEGKPLGERGLQWLKIHLANLCGFDKADFQGRVQYAEDHLEDIFDSADHPLDGRGFWMTAADPWQALAVCFELTAALRSPDPTAFRSRLAVHQDGTCNGLQHYAALGGDTEGARQVNLEPSDKPQDIYTYVSDRVSAMVAKDAEAGLEIAQVLNGKIKRKVVKQSVMTNVYGVTYVGARAQIMSQLKDLEDVPEIYVWKGASYLAKLVFHVVRDLFSGAHLIQDWLGECARRISKSLPPNSADDLENTKSMTAVIWTSPLGLPVVQPYRATVRKQVSTNLQTVYISDPNELHPVNSRKQQAAFPPNFIHSLDATHMLLSALACGRNGLTFAAVHDSYWTHAADVDRMNAILRDAFIKLHEGDLVTKLKQEFEQRYKGYMYPVEISTTCDEAKQIQRWRRAKRAELKRALTGRDEVDMETERLHLLKSDDPEKRAKGAAMVTPLSIIGNTPMESLRPREVKQQVSSKRSEYMSSENEFERFTSDDIIRQTLGVPKDSSAEPVEEEAENLEAEDDESHLSEDDEDSTAKLLEEVEGQVGDAPLATYHSSIKRYMKGMPIYVPLTFPDVPPKGDFDVQKLKKSLYFFS